MPDTLNGRNGNGKLWWRGTAVAAALAWGTWVTVHVANYVSGEARGERLTTNEAKLMIEIDHQHLRIERTAEIGVMEARILEKLSELKEQVKVLNERLRQDEMSRNSRP